MKCQIIFSRKKNIYIYIRISSAEIFTQDAMCYVSAQGFSFWSTYSTTKGIAEIL